MLRVGSQASSFDCSLVLQGQLQSCAWNELHDGKTLILHFCSTTQLSQFPDHLAALVSAAERCGRLGARSAAVLPETDLEILSWLEPAPDKQPIEEVGLSFIVDSSAEIASLYDMFDPECNRLFGHVVVDSSRLVRVFTANSFPLSTNAEELEQCVAVIA
jgi:alkyl hydroperoxide reductase subunit AhpC